MLTGQYASSPLTAWNLNHLRAMILSAGTKWSEAAPAWQGLIDNAGAQLAEKFHTTLAGCYLQLAKARYFSGDSLGAVLALEELRARFPAWHETDTATQLISEHLLREPQLREAFEEQQPLIAAKWKPRPVLPDKRMNDNSLAQLSMPTGGAE